MNGSPHDGPVAGDGFSHPTENELQRWLESGSPEWIIEHVNTCDDCMGELERLSDFDEVEMIDLASAISAPADIETRTVQGVERRIRNEEAMAAFLDLFAIGFDTVQAIVQGDAAALNEPEPPPMENPAPPNPERKGDRR